MCPMADVLEVRDRLQKRTVEKIENEDLLKEGNIGAIENVSREKNYFFETRNVIREIDAIPAKITMLLNRKTSIILNSEEDPEKPWYFTHV